MDNKRFNLGVVELTVITAIIVAVVIATVGTFSYRMKMRQHVRPGQYTGPEMVMKKFRTLTVPLEGQGSFVGFGFGTIMEIDGKVRVTLNINSKDIHPAHIHLGSCPNVGGVKYPLVNIVNGVSQTDLTVSMDELVNQLPLAINAHKSSTEMGTYVVCGNIQKGMGINMELPVMTPVINPNF